MSRPIVPWLLGGSLVAVVTWAAIKPAGGQADKGGPGDKPTLVSTVLSQAQDVPLRFEAQGTVTALNMVELRPQVSSTIRTIHIREGQDVKAGQLLFTLDTREDSSRVEQSSAELAQARAQLQEAERNLARSRELLKQQFISQSAVDSAQSTADSLRASLAAKQAALGSAKVGLSYQSISAPFAGRTGAVDFHPGSLVQPGMAQALTSVTQLDPIAVSFTLPERELQRLLAAQQAGQAPAYVTLDSGERVQGKLSFIDSNVNADSGTIRLKAEFPNGKHQLWPGAFARVAVDLGMEKQAVTLPAGALQTGPQGQFVYLVAPDNTVKPQAIKLSRIITQDGKQYGVVSGLPAGKKVVVEGGQNLRPGAAISEGKAGGEKRQGKPG